MEALDYPVGSLVKPNPIHSAIRKYLTPLTSARILNSRNTDGSYSVELTILTSYFEPNHDYMMEADVGESIDISPLSIQLYDITHISKRMVLEEMEIEKVEYASLNQRSDVKNQRIKVYQEQLRYLIGQPIVVLATEHMKKEKPFLPNI